MVTNEFPDIRSLFIKVIFVFKMYNVKKNIIKDHLERYLTKRSTSHDHWLGSHRSVPGLVAGVKPGGSHRLVVISDANDP